MARAPRRGRGPRRERGRPRRGGRTRGTVLDPRRHGTARHRAGGRRPGPAAAGHLRPDDGRPHGPPERAARTGLAGPRPGRLPAGQVWGPKSYGHTGFTGTSLWADPETGRYAVLLTNRVHPTRAGESITGVRRAFHDTAAALRTDDRPRSRT
ncbi:beta-lactamase family protein [Streptomyces albus]|nr:beta-lactamase family protein [Streptomyces albus]